MRVRVHKCERERGLPISLTALLWREHYRAPHSSMFEREGERDIYRRGERENCMCFFLAVMHVGASAAVVVASLLSVCVLAAKQESTTAECSQIKTGKRNK